MKNLLLFNTLTPIEIIAIAAMLGLFIILAYLTANFFSSLIAKIFGKKSDNAKSSSYAQYEKSKPPYNPKKFNSLRLLEFLKGEDYYIPLSKIISFYKKEFKYILTNERIKILKNFSPRLEGLFF